MLLDDATDIAIESATIDRAFGLLEFFKNIEEMLAQRSSTGTRAYANGGSGENADESDNIEDHDLQPPVTMPQMKDTDLIRRLFMRLTPIKDSTSIFQVTKSDIYKLITKKDPANWTKLGITEFNAIGDRIPSSMGAFDKESSIITINIPEDEATEETIATFKGSLRMLANISFTDLKGGLLKKASTMRVGRAGRDARAGAKRAKPSDGEEALGQM